MTFKLLSKWTITPSCVNSKDISVYNKKVPAIFNIYSLKMIIKTLEHTTNLSSNFHQFSNKIANIDI